MPWTAERQTINQRLQFGAESNTALGTNVAAGKLLECFDFVFTIMADTMEYVPTGHKYPNIQEENEEWAEATMAGNLDYNGIIYPLCSVGGAVAPVAHGASAVAKDWIIAPPLTGSVVPQTYTIEQGDAVRAHKVNYGLFVDFGYKGTRKDFTVTGKLIAQAIQDGITLTPAPVAVPVAPVIAKQVNVYLDSTSAALGTTLLSRVLSVDFSMTGTYNPLWVLNRANVSYTAHVDVAPKVRFKLKLEADLNGMTLLNYLQQGTTYFCRVQALGGVIDNNQTVTLGTQSSGTFTLTYKGQTTATIAYNATAAAVQTALLLLSTLPAGTISVTGAAGGPYTIQMLTSLINDTTPFTGSGTLLTTPANFVITQTQVYQTIQHDMALKIGKPTAFGDDQGVFAIEWDCPIIEDFTWNKSHLFTVTNLLTTL